MKLLSSVVLALAAAGSAWAQLSADRVLVVVNGEPILGRQYYPRMEVLPGTGKLIGQQFVQASPGFLTLQALINERLMLQLAKEQNVFPNEAEIKAAVDDRKKESPNLLQAFALLGLTEDDFRNDTLVQLCEFKIVTKGVNITDFEVDKFYKDNQSTRFTLPKRFLLRVISVGDEATANKVDAALAAGKPIAEVAREFSVDSSSLQGGFYGEIAEAELRGMVKDAVVKTKKGAWTDWLVSDQIRAKFFVEDIREQQVIAFDASLKESIRRQLMIDKGQAKNNIMKLMDDMRKKAKFDFKGTPFDEQIKAAFNGVG